MEPDAQLTARVERLLGDRHRVVGAATVVPGRTSVAVRGASASADFEIGSISKGVTGLLYADAVERGEVTAATTLGELLPFGSAPAAAATLGSIAIHRSGLPRLAAGHPLRRSIALWRHGRNPYGESLDELLDQARTVKLRRPRTRYSNVGFELLGHALAAAAGTSYAELVRDRVAGPLGLGTFYVATDPTALRPGALSGTSRLGRPMEPWTGEALGPAGGIRATVGAMAGLVSALLDGAAPGAAALDPVAPFAGKAVRIGAAWVVLEVDGRVVTWHNGGTGGFRSWLGLDRAAGIGVVLLTARAAAVDRQALDLLREVAGGRG